MVINKKGSLSDVLFIGVQLLLVAMVVLIIFKVSNSIDDEIQTSDTIGDLQGASDARAASSAMNSHFSGALDNSFLFLTIGLAIVTIGLAVAVRIHPVFFIFFIMGLVFLIFICGILSNIYQEMATQPELLSEANELVFTTFILRFLPFIVGILGGILSIILYTNWSKAR
jgi:magnesium-transporting ATPase (P-type)